MKDVVISTLAPATIFTGTFDFVAFPPNWVVMLTDATEQRKGFSWANTNIQKVVVSPAGTAYPGDATPGLGPKKVTIDFIGAPATVVMNQVETVNTDSGWLYIIKGEHVIAYSPSVVDNAIVEPST